MAIQVQLRRGTATQNNAFTGAIGELSFDTTNNQLRVHDGSTAGGFKIGTGDFPTGTANVALGNTALDSLDSGSPGGNNVAVGHDALTANTTASNNVAVGSGSLAANTTAANSTAVGASALAASTGTLNTAIGKGSGSLITTGTKNTILGSYSGNQGSVDIRTSNNHIVLSDGDGNPRVIVNDSGNVGIGTGSPTEKITIDSGNLNFIGGTGDTQYIKFGDSGDDDIGNIFYYHGNDNMVFTTNASEAMRINDSGKIGIGATSIDEKLHVENASGTTLVKTEVASGSLVGFEIQKTGATNQQWRIADGISANGRLEIYDVTDTRCLAAFHGDGRVSIASNSTSAAVSGFVVESEGDTYITAEGVESRVLVLNRLTSDGDEIEFRKDNSEVGVIGTVGGDLAIGTGNTGLRFVDGSDSIQPIELSAYNRRDNAIDLGNGSYRFDDIYATNGTIQTSDEREKQNIASLTEAEITAAKAISKLFKTFKWKDKVSAKGDAARTHAGVIAQQVETAMSDAGLDATNYAFFTSTTWWETETEVAAVEGIEAQEEVYDDDGHLVQERVKGRDAKDAYTKIDTYYTEDDAPEGATERNRKGIRYPELLAFIGAATEQRLTSIEARLDALEG